MKEYGLPLVVLPPLSEPIVTAIITSPPSIIGACRGISLFGGDSIGSAGLPLSFIYKWSTISPTPSDQIDNITSAITQLSLTSLTNGIPLRTLLLPSSYFSVNTSYGFQLTVTNWRGVSSTSDIITVYKSSDVQLEVVIEGLTMRNVITSSPSLVSVGDYNSLSLCGVTIMSASYQWSQVDGPELDIILGSTTKTMIITPYQLTPLATYSFQLMVTLITSFGTTLSSSAITIWYVTPSSLQPVIQGNAYKHHYHPSLYHARVTHLY